MALFTAIFLATNFAQAADSAPEIWIAVRTDGKSGAGTAANPYDGHTALLFDKIMQGIAPQTVVHLGAGLFRTTGAAGYNPNGYYLPPGCKIIGAGMDQTTVRCVFYPLAAGLNGHSVLQSRRDADGAGTEVTDLTVDCNWQNLGAPAASRIGAVSLSGNNCAIRRVRAINAYGNWASLAETFVLAISNYYSGNGWQDVSGDVIEDSQALSFLGDYGGAICFLGGADNTGFISGVIQRCRVDNWNGTAAYGVSGAQGVQFIDNETYNCQFSMHFDTGQLRDLEISGNHFYGIGLRGIDLQLGLGTPYADGIHIHNNFFEVSDAQTPTPAAIAIGQSQPGLQKQITITANTIVHKSSGTNNPIAGIVVAYSDTVFVAQNYVESVFQNNLHLSDQYKNTAVTVVGNIDELGHRATSLEDVAASVGLAAPANQKLITSTGELLYLAEFGSKTIAKVDGNGNRASLVHATQSSPSGMVLDAAGNSYVSTSGNTIEKFDPNGRALGVFATSGLNAPKALAFDADGKLYAANYGSNTVEVFAADGSDLGPFAQVSRPTGLIFDLAGNLYVSNFENTIERFRPDGTSLGTFTSTGLNNPNGMAFDASGILYVANSGSNKIKRYSTAGRELGELTSAGLSGPTGLVMDAAGNLYTSNAQTATIQKIAPDGTSTVFATTGANPAFLALQSAPSLVNISTRLRILPGDGVLVGGFIISGAGTKRVLIRGLGPSLASAGLTGTLADPSLELHGGPANAVLAKNDNWQLTQPNAIEATGLQPTSAAEAAMIVTLSEGAYSVIESGNNGTSGVGLVEIYDLTPGTGPVLANISTRGFVDTGSNVMIAGFIVAARAGGNSTVLLRGLGPSLGAAGVANPLTDPVLDLHDSNGALVASNDNWQTAQTAEIEATSLAPTKTAEAAILATLAPGAYTAIESGKNGGTGVGLVEVYNLR